MSDEYQSEVGGSALSCRNREIVAEPREFGWAIPVYLLLSFAAPMLFAFCFLCFLLCALSTPPRPVRCFLLFALCFELYALRFLFFALCFLFIVLSFLLFAFCFVACCLLLFALFIKFFQLDYIQDQQELISQK